MPSPEPATQQRDDTAMPEMVSKRRGTTHGGATHASLLPKPTNVVATITFVAGRRRRLFAYLSAFAIMLALSSMLDLRRAALSAKRHDRITLQPPPGPPATSVDEDSHPADGAAIAHEAELLQKQGASRPPPLVPNTDHSETHGDDIHALPNSKSSAPTGTVTHPQPGPAAPDRKLSDQELADDVDQLISHVEQEKAVANSTGATPANDTTTVHQHSATATASTASTAPTTVLSHGKVVGTSEMASPGPAANHTLDDAGATVEEQFAAAQKAMDGAAANDTLRPYLDAQEARTLKALALQGARGDCEKAVDPSGGALFKTDADAASGDIEKTDALWGAWCVFSGRYRSDAMRDYVARTKALRARLAAKAQDNAPPDHAEPFDDTAATLDDVLGPDEQAALRAKADRVVPHLSEADARLLAALALQATLGDCAPYARKKPDGARELVEPLFGKKATRGEGTLWGAWCVFARRKRVAAVATLKDRIDQFYKQLAPPN